MNFKINLLVIKVLIIILTIIFINPKDILLFFIIIQNYYLNLNYSFHFKSVSKIKVLCFNNSFSKY